MPENPHQATLRPYIELHESELADLREQAETLRRLLGRKPPLDLPKPLPVRSALESDLAAVERSISKHQQAIDLAREERVGEVLKAVADDPELAREAAADPRGFAVRHGLEKLPETLAMSVLVAGDEVSARFSNLDPDMPFELVWTRYGFQSPPESDAALVVGQGAGEP